MLETMMERLKLSLSKQIEELSEYVTHGACRSYEDYRYSVGKLNALRQTVEEIEEEEKKFLEE